jgi:hypothetical protein
MSIVTGSDDGRAWSTGLGSGCNGAGGPGESSSTGDGCGAATISTIDTNSVDAGGCGGVLFVNANAIRATPLAAGTAPNRPTKRSRSPTKLDLTLANPTDGY